MSTIARLREIGSFDGSKGWYSDRDPRIEEIEDLLYEGKVVHSEFEDGGRWSNYETEIYEIEEFNGDSHEVAYFLKMEERPATESQEGMDTQFEFYEVEPYQVTVTKYRGKF
jgi:hypothetical protein